MNLAQFNQKEMKKAKVYMYDKMAGILTEDEDGFHFQYDQSYLKSKEAEPVSLTLPLTDKAFESKTMFPFFDGLIPEGWLLDIAHIYFIAFRYLSSLICHSWHTKYIKIID